MSALLVLLSVLVTALVAWLDSREVRRELQRRRVAEFEAWLQRCGRHGRARW